MSGHQPKELTELAFASFITYMKDKVLQLLNWMKLSPTSIDEATKTCSELKDFFHGTRLPPVWANEITKQLLTKLDKFFVICKSTRNFQQNFLTLVELFMHPDVTSFELVPYYLSKCNYLYPEFILTSILMKVGSLSNLKTLSVKGEFDIQLKGIKLVLPAQLRELRLYDTCSKYYSVKSIVECCKELKSLKIVRCCVGLSINSVPHLLKLNRLETLHLIRENDYDSDAAYVALINGISTDVTSKVLSASTLKSFGIKLRSENTLHLIVDKLPHLTEIVLQLPYEVDHSCLTQLKNLRSLALDVGGRPSDDYKKILPVLGKSLVSLDLRRYKSLDLEFIGETCSNLRCLHVDTTTDSETRPKPPFKTFPNFRTVECLKVLMYHKSPHEIEFLIVQCVNIKVLCVVIFSQIKVIQSILKRASLLNLEEIHWSPEVRIDNSCLGELILKSPNLRLVHGLGPNRVISGRVDFSFHGCHKRFCEFHCNVLDTLDVTSGDETEYMLTDSSSDSTSDSDSL